MTCNGWKNWETWNLNVWLDNDGFRSNVSDIDYFREEVEEFLGIDYSKSSFQQDVINNALHEVDWKALFGYFTDRDDEANQYDDEE